MPLLKTESWKCVKRATDALGAVYRGSVQVWMQATGGSGRLLLLLKLVQVFNFFIYFYNSLRRFVEVKVKVKVYSFNKCRKGGGGGAGGGSRSRVLRFAGFVRSLFCGGRCAFCAEW